MVGVEPGTIVVVASAVVSMVVVVAFVVVATVGVVTAVVVAGAVVVVGAAVRSVGTILSNAWYDSSASMPPSVLAEESRQREVEALKEMDRQVASAVHLALHASTSATFVFLPMMLPVTPVPRGS